jgi:carboxypeptidase PM20D1
MKKIALFFGAILLILATIIVSKTISNAPGAHQKSTALEILPAEAIAHMSQAIQIKTETPNDAYEFDTTTFFAYRKFIEKAYPLVHKNLPRTVIDSFNYIYEWKGTDTSILPMVLMAHYDVVPVEASAVKLWHAVPYGGEVKEG